LALAPSLLDGGTMKALQIFLVGALLGGCTVMVNGKPRRIGGGSDPDPAASAAAAPTTSAAAAAPARSPAAQPAAAPAVAALPPGQIIKVPPTLGRDPLVVAFDASFDTSWSKVFGHGSRSPDCGLDIPSRPIGSFEITAADRDLHVSLVGGANDGFVVRKGDLYWTACTHSIGEVPTMAPGKDGWEPGRYDVFPVARYNDRGQLKRFALELYKPNAPVVADGAQPLVISGKLAKPLFVEVVTRPNRRALREAHAGYGCEQVALPATPDLALSIERPIPGLVIRPLPTTTPVTLRKEAAATDERRAEKGCATRGGGRASHQPSYVAPSELHLDKAEGTFGISLGTPSPEDEVKVTLMVFDASTTFDPLAVRPFGGEQPTLEQRWIGYQLPQLDADELGSADNHAEAEHGARVFAAVPKQALVYAKLTFDKDLGGGDGYPVKNEPLVLLDLDRGSAKVMTADGLRFQVKASHVVLAPDGPIAVPTAPRPMRKLDIGGTIAMLPPTDKKLGEAHWAKVKARDACIDRAWEPYRRQLPTYTRPAGVEVVVYKSARTKNIEEAGDRAIIKQCGSREAFEKQTEATRVKLAERVEKARAKLLAQATATLK